MIASFSTLKISSRNTKKPRKGSCDENENKSRKSSSLSTSLTFSLSPTFKCITSCSGMSTRWTQHWKGSSFHALMKSGSSRDRTSVRESEINKWWKSDWSSTEIQARLNEMMMMLKSCGGKRSSQDFKMNSSPFHSCSYSVSGICGKTYHFSPANRIECECKQHD